MSTYDPNLIEVKSKVYIVVCVCICNSSQLVAVRAECLAGP